MNFTANDGYGDFSVEATSLQMAVEAAREQVIGAADADDTTYWMQLNVQNDDDEDENSVEKLAIHPDIPACIDGEDHQWESPHEIVGGIVSNPGVWASNGAGTESTECCMHCFCARIEDDGAQDRQTGEHLYSVRYIIGKFAEHKEE